MRLSTLCAATVLAVASVGLAHATTTDLITNGDFSIPGLTTPWGFGTLGSGSAGFYGGSSCTDGDPLINGWSGNGGYEIWYPDAASASTVEPCAYYHSETQKLTAIAAPPSASGSVSFVGLDGITSPVPHAGVSQTVNGLTPGASYTVTFWWGSTQLQNRTGPTTEQLQVWLGDPDHPSDSQYTGVNSIGSHGWSGWSEVSMTFLANSSSEVLSFLSLGTPNSLPPFAVLTGVSMHAVPEPPELAMFGIGLLGLGLLTVFARCRARRRPAEVGDSDID